MTIQNIFTNPEKFWYIQYNISNNTAHTVRVKQFKLIETRKGRALLKPFIGLDNVGKFGAAIHKDATHWGIVYIENDDQNPIFVHQQKFVTTTRGVLHKSIMPLDNTQNISLNTIQSISTITVIISKNQNEQAGIQP